MSDAVLIAIITGLFAALPALAGLVVSLRNHANITTVKQQTDGMNKIMIAQAESIGKTKGAATEKAKRA